MSRERSPERERAYKIWEDSGRFKQPKQIAHEVGVSDSMVRKWKSQDKWDETPLPKPKRRGAPKGNKNAEGNKGGLGGPVQNEKAVKHGFFRKYLPEEMTNLMDEIGELEPIDILYNMIKMQYAAIIKTSSINYVRERDDHLKVKSGKFTVIGAYAHDKQLSTLSGQSTAMTALNNLIRRYDQMLKGYDDELKRLDIETMKVKLKALGGGDDKKTKLEEYLL